MTVVDQELLDACREYFEISIGYRRPTGSERQEASERWLDTVLSEDEIEPVDIVKMLKYPIELDTRSSLWYNGIFPDSEDPKLIILLIEYDIFEILSNETTLIDGPYIPMLRYETNVLKELFQNEEYPFIVLQQHAFLETLFRLKAGLGQVKWEWTVKSVFRGECLIDKRAYSDLDEFNELRNNLAHDWFSYIEVSNQRVRDIARKGLRVISSLYTKELYETFDSYSSKHPSQRLPTKLEQRASASISGSANASVLITCDDCGREFNPQNHWKRCPQCQSWHGYWALETEN
jgi:hypothetical protein